MIWVIGCKGMLGSELALQLTQANIPWTGTGEEVDITNPQALENFFNSTETASYLSSHNTENLADNGKIRWIINCAAYTAVDQSETDAGKAHAVNADGPMNIARTARAHGARLIHISTDYVFDGTADIPYTENFPKTPLGVYGRTKLEGENNVSKGMTQYYIIRTSWLYGAGGHNFVYTMTNLMNRNDSVKVVNDQKGSPTFCGDLASVILRFIEKADSATSFFGKNSAAPYGTYNFTDDGETTWYEFAKAIYQYGQKFGRITHDCDIQPCTTAEYPSKAARPAYSVLSKNKIEKELHIKIPSWESSLERFMKSGRFSPEK
ncbi:MAG: dTDP-4-dehydrorhamnose reductase [Treponema sp.]